jgi:ElaB/YqjD/DUF883 family membrane-anchored ribosome-binding protein
MKSQTHGNGNADSTGTSHSNGQAAEHAPIESAEAIDAVLEQVSENAEAILSEIKTAVEETVKKYPVQSVLVCLGVGCVLGALWSGRR